MNEFIIIELKTNYWINKSLLHEHVAICSNIIEGIKAVFFFFHEKISHIQKAQNANKQLSLKYFLYAQKAQKT